MNGTSSGTLAGLTKRQVQPDDLQIRQVTTVHRCGGRRHQICQYDLDAGRGEATRQVTGVVYAELPLKSDRFSFPGCGVTGHDKVTYVVNINQRAEGRRTCQSQRRRALTGGGRTSQQ